MSYISVECPILIKSSNYRIKGKFYTSHNNVIQSSYSNLKFNPKPSVIIIIITGDKCAKHARLQKAKIYLRLWEIAHVREIQSSFIKYTKVHGERLIIGATPTRLDYFATIYTY